jgi:hypothetical protein
MFVCMTKHFKGSFPCDVGGLMLGGYGPKQVTEALGKHIVKFGFPFVVECDKSGKYLVDVPPVKVVEIDEKGKVETKEEKPVSVNEVEKPSAQPTIELG